MNATTVTIRCSQCDKIQGDFEGLWMLCQNCGTFRCPDCYENPMEQCPGCAERSGRKTASAKRGDMLSRCF